MKRFGVVLAILLASVSARAGDDDVMSKIIATAKSEKVPQMMQAKLEAHKRLLEAVIREDYDTLGREAEKLRQIAQKATWQSLRTKGFVAKSRSFQDAVSDLFEKSKERKMERVALPYVRLTLSCLECHELVRKPHYQQRSK